MCHLSYCVRVKAGLCASPPCRGSGCDFASTSTCMCCCKRQGCVCTLDDALRRGSVFLHACVERTASVVWPTRINIDTIPLNQALAIYTAGFLRVTITLAQCRLRNSPHVYAYEYVLVFGSVVCVGRHLSAPKVPVPHLTVVRWASVLFLWPDVCLARSITVRTK